MTISHDVFAPIQVDPDGSAEWSGSVDLEGRAVRFALTCDDHTALSSADLDRCAPFFTELPRFDALARQAIAGKAADESGDVATYVSHHLEELDSETLRRIFGHPAPVTPEDFLARLHLVSVALYPSKPQGAAVFDYSIGKDATQYLLVVRFDGAQGVTDIAMES